MDVDAIEAGVAGMGACLGEGRHQFRDFMGMKRRSSAADPQGVEYQLTPLGASLKPVLESLIDWGTFHATELDEADRLLPCAAVVRHRAA